MPKTLTPYSPLQEALIVTLVPALPCGGVASAASLKYDLSSHPLVRQASVQEVTNALAGLVRRGIVESHYDSRPSLRHRAYRLRKHI